jgi:2-phospho-L-lactate/phosphoenolpyruvate guanylyltransferase
MPGGTYAVIPVKPFTSAKRRLAPILNSFERMHLARLMLSDVLDTVSAARNLAGFIVVTCNREAEAMARAWGGDAIHEDGEFGLGAAVERGLRALDGIADGAVVIPSDIPHLPQETIEDVIRLTSDHGVAMVPALDDNGTNLLSLRPCTVVPPLYGPDSFIRHRRAALSVGATTRIRICPLAGHDLDRPTDLMTFLSFGTPTRTQGYLAGLGIDERLAAASGFDVPADFARATA